jgi:hypothetical protein
MALFTNTDSACEHRREKQDMSLQSCRSSRKYYANLYTGTSRLYVYDQSDNTVLS